MRLSWTRGEQIGSVMGKHADKRVGRHSGSSKGKHRAESMDDPANTTEPVHGGGYKTKLAHIVVASGALALVTASAQPAGTAPKQVRHVSAKQETEQLPIVAKTAPVAFDKVQVKTEAKPKPKHVAPKPAPAPQIVQKAPEVNKNYVRPAPPVAKYVPVPAPKPAPATAPAKKLLPPPPVAASATGAAIAAAALAQLGRRQDCTRLVTNSLAAVGIAHHGWPISYVSLGTRVPEGQQQPGDLIYYVNGGMGLAHIAVYIGNGLAVHGGWHGNQTVTFKANVGSGPVYIRVRS